MTALSSIFETYGMMEKLTSPKQTKQVEICASHK
jgi:hypothetical protein